MIDTREFHCIASNYILIYILSYPLKLILRRHEPNRVLLRFDYDPPPWVNDLIYSFYSLDRFKFVFLMGILVQISLENRDLFHFFHFLSDSL
jgi:hypothetical protein